MECENIQQVALPWNGLSTRLELQAGEACDRAIRSMLTRNPFWIIDGQRSGLDRHHEMDMQQLLLCLGGIHSQRDILGCECSSSDECEDRSQKKQQTKTNCCHPNTPFVNRHKSRPNMIFSSALSLRDRKSVV